MNDFARGLAPTRVPRRALRVPVHARAADRREVRRAGPGARPAGRLARGDRGAGRRRRGSSIGGKSLGGRMASLVADEAGDRRARLPRVSRSIRRDSRTGSGRSTSPTCGRRRSSSRERATRSARGRTCAAYELSPSIRIEWIEDGDHSWKPRASSGRTLAQNLQEGVAKTVRVRARRFCPEANKIARMDEDREDRRRVARRAHARAVPGPAEEGDRAAVHGRVRQGKGGRDVPVRRLRQRALPIRARSSTPEPAGRASGRRRSEEPSGRRRTGASS